MIKIQKYKVDDFEHHVPEFIDEAFKAEVKKANKKCHPIADSYPVSPERHQEACNNPVVDNKIFHSQDGVWLEAIENVDVLIYEVTDDFIIHCPWHQMDALEKRIKVHNPQYEEGEPYSLTIREYQDKVKHSTNPCFYPLVPKDISSEEFDYEVASWFAQELTKRNIKTIEDIDMKTATQTKEQKLAQMADLMTYLSSCTRTFLDELILTFNNEEAIVQYQYAHSTKKKQDAMYKIITKNPEEGLNQYQSIKDFHNYVQKSAESVKEAQETMKSYRSGLQAKVNNISNDFEIKKETRDYQKEILGQLKCCKLIENGLKGYGKAVVAGTIIGKQDQVVAAANYVAAEVSKMAQVQNVDDKSLEGVKTVIKNVNSGINNLVASLHTQDGELNALADRLAAETKTQRDQMANKVSEVVKQKAGT